MLISEKKAVEYIWKHLLNPNLNRIRIKMKSIRNIGLIDRKPLKGQGYIIVYLWYIYTPGHYICTQQYTRLQALESNRQF